MIYINQCLLLNNVTKILKFYHEDNCDVQMRVKSKLFQRHVKITDLHIILGLSVYYIYNMDNISGA